MMEVGARMFFVGTDRAGAFFIEDAAVFTKLGIGNLERSFVGDERCAWA